MPILRIQLGGLNVVVELNHHAVQVAAAIRHATLVTRWNA
jgi:hypothetical protein